MNQKHIKYKSVSIDVAILAKELGFRQYYDELPMASYHILEKPKFYEVWKLPAYDKSRVAAPTVFQLQDWLREYNFHIIVDFEDSKYEWGINDARLDVQFTYNEKFDDYHKALDDALFYSLDRLKNFQ